VSLDDRSSDNQPHAEAIALRGEELFEDFFAFGRKTNSEIPHGQLHADCAVARGREEDYPSLRVGILRGIKGVGNKVEEHLLELNYRFSAWFEVHAYLQPRASPSMTTRRLGNDVIQVKEFPWKFALLDHVAHASDHFPGTLSIIGDILQNLAELRGIPFSLVKQALPNLRVGNDTRHGWLSSWAA
jgi:hypothetical protein